MQGSAIYKTLSDSGTPLSHQDEQGNIGLYQIQGKRSSQEDTTAYGVLDPTYHGLDFEMAFRATVKEIDKKIRRYKYSGTCLLSNIVIGNKVHTANLGDSLTYIVILKKNGSLNNIELINQLHNPEESVETELLSESDVPVIDGRVADSLAVSRALGDRDILGDYKQAVEIDYSKTTVNLADGEQAFVIVASDGLIEGLSHKKTGAIVSKSRNETSVMIAEALVHAAEEEQTSDNVSILVTPIEPVSKTIKLLSVFDGHRDNRLSAYVANNFAKILTKNMNTQLTTNDYPPLKVKKIKLKTKRKPD